MASKTIDTNTDYITILCPNCGHEAKIDMSTGTSNGYVSWHNYCCPRCGDVGAIEDDEIQSKHAAYSLNKLYKKLIQTPPLSAEPLEKNMSIINLDSLKRIADSLDDIKDLLKKLLEK